MFDLIQTGLIVNYGDVRGREREREEKRHTPNARKTIVASMTSAKILIYRSVAVTFSLRTSISFIVIAASLFKSLILSFKLFLCTSDLSISCPALQPCLNPSSPFQSVLQPYPILLPLRFSLV
jgi:hypothetical protein